MKLGNSVPSLEDEGVFFVEEDLFNIAKRVKEYDSEAALVCHKPEGMRLGIARYLTDAKWAPGGAWVIAFWCNDQETGEALCNEPDARVLNLMEQFDSHNRGNQERVLTRARKILAMREYRRQLEIRDRTGEIAETTNHAWKQAKGIKHKIYVPSSVAA